MKKPTSSTKPRLYSYQRWSSARQAGGTTLERQTKAAREYAAEHGYEYVEPFTDAGVSAFKSRNQTSGQLGVFIDLVEQGVIPAGSAMFIEALDRLSRAEITTANKLFLELLDLGLTLITGMDGKVYTRESVNKNPTDLMLSILLFMRANEESETKSKRVRGNALALVERFKRGEPANIKSVGNVPWWVDATGSQNEAVRKHPVHWAAARKACELFMEGWGVHRIVGYLNDNKEIYPAPRRKKKVNGSLPPPAWNHAIISKIQLRYVENKDPSVTDSKGEVKKYVGLPNDAIRGDWAIYIDGRAEVLRGYFPPLVSDVEFARLHEMRLGNRFKVGMERKVIPLLAGIKRLRCGHCGGAMRFHSQSSKGGTKPRTLRYVCLKSIQEPTKCRLWSLSGALLENTGVRALIYGVVNSAVLSGLPVEDLTPQIEAGRERLDSIKSQIDNFTAAIGLGGNLETLVSSIKRLEEEKTNTLLELDRFQQQQALAGSEEDTHKRLAATMSQLTPELLADTTLVDRTAVREMCRQVFHDVTVECRTDKSYRIQYMYPNGSMLIFEGVWLPTAKKDGKPTRGFTVFTLSPDGQRHDDIYSQISQAVSTDEVPVSLSAPAMEAVERLALRLGHQPLHGKDFFTLRNQ